MSEKPASRTGAIQFRRDVIRALKKSGFNVTPDKFTRAYLKHYGFAPATFIDVGVHRGTPELYELFRESRIVLIDPVPDVETFCEPWLKGEGWNAQFVNCALGAGPGSARITVSGPMTSLLTRLADGGRADGQALDVQVRRLDDVVAELAPDGPFGVKIDTEGYELEVIRGAARTLSQTEFVIAEVSARRRFQDGYLFADLVAEMARAGFALADILSTPSHARYFDCLFVRQDSPILSRHKISG